MPKRVILVTGTPCVGKTSAARLLSSRLDALCVNLTELAVNERLISGRDEERDSVIVDEDRMRRRIGEIIDDCSKDIVIDGHHAATVVPRKCVTRIFVLRRDPTELRELMEKNGFSGRKLWENLASEILDTCLVEALNLHGKEKVCELDASGRSIEEVVKEILDTLEGRRRCHVGIVDWLGMLEQKGLLDEFMRI